MPEEQLPPRDPADPEPTSESAADPASANVLVWRRLACGLVGLEAVGLAVVALSALVILLGGGAAVPMNEVLLGILCAFAALGLGFIAREALRGHPRVRTPGVFFQVLLLLLVPSMGSQGNPLLAAGVGVLAVLSAVAVVLATRRR